MAKTPRLGVTLPEGSTNVTTQFFIDRFNEIDKGAETPTDAQKRVDDLKAITQNKKITKDNGLPAVEVVSNQRDLLDDIMAKGAGFHTFSSRVGVKSMPDGAADLTGTAHVISPDEAYIFATDNMGDQYVRVRSSGAWKQWERVAKRKIETLWSGDTRGNFSTTYTLTETLNRYDFVYFIAAFESSSFSYERFVHVESIPTDTHMVWEVANLADNAGSTVWTAGEMALAFNASRTSFQMSRAVRIGYTGVTSSTRYDNIANLGLTKIIGVKF